MAYLERLKQAAGSTCIFSLAGPVESAREMCLFREIQPIGVIFFKRNIESLNSLASLCGDLRKHHESLRIFAIDEEGGRVRRLPTGDYSLPSANELASFDEMLFTDRVRRLGRELRARGITVTMAPVVDLRSGEDTSIVGDRAFSDDPAAVIRHARRYLTALHAQGVAGVIKHFPGHGATTVDSHKELPRIDKRLDDLKESDLLPYYALATEAPFVMAAHILVPSLDPVLPASLSPAWMRLLREEIGFRGLVLSDDLEMHALDRWTAAEKARLFLEAGGDLALVCSGNEETMQAHWEAILRAAEENDEMLRRLEHRARIVEETLAAIAAAP